MKYGVSVEGWEGFEVRERQEIVEWWFEKKEGIRVENTRSYYFNSSTGKIYGVGRGGVIVLYDREECRGWRVTGLEEIKFMKNLEEVLDKKPEEK